MQTCVTALQYKVPKDAGSFNIFIPATRFPRSLKMSGQVLDLRAVESGGRTVVSRDRGGAGGLCVVQRNSCGQLVVLRLLIL